MQVREESSTSDEENEGFLSTMDNIGQQSREPTGSTTITPATTRAFLDTLAGLAIVLLTTLWAVALASAREMALVVP